MTTVFVTHDRREAMAFANRVGVLNGSPSNAKTIDERPAAAFVQSFLSGDR
jgi:ABC-type proline/glycine betaine transport system ATPase subunit